MNRSLSLRRLLTQSLFQAALLGIPAISLLLGACTQQIGGTGTTTTGSGGSGSSAGGQGGSVGCPPSMASGTGYFVEVGRPCFPWTDLEATGAGGMGGGAAGTGGEGGNTALACPAPKMAPASWGLDMHPMNAIEGPYDTEHLDGTCCYGIELLCI